MKDSLDNLTNTYVSIITEWKKKTSVNDKADLAYSPMQVALAVKDATNDFADQWAKGGTNKIVYSLLLDADEDLPEEKWNEGRDLVLDAFHYWCDQTGEFADKIKSLFPSPVIYGDSVGLFSYAIWQGVVAERMKKSNIMDDIKSGDKVELDFVYDDYYDTVYNYGRAHGYKNHWTNFDQHTYHFIFTCEKYPHVKFDIVFFKNGCPDLAKGDKVKVNAKVKYFDDKKSTVFMNYGKIIGEVIKAEVPKEVKPESKDNSKKSKREIAENLKTSIKNTLVNALAPIDQAGFDKVFDNLMDYECYDNASSGSFFREFAKELQQYVEAIEDDAVYNELRDNISAYYELVVTS